MADSRILENLDVTPVPPPLSDAYRWEVPGKKVSVCLDFGVIDRLLVEVMRGFGAIPRRGAEVGGILVGTVEHTMDGAVVRIEDFEPVVCEHRRGPSYLLADSDGTKFSEAVERLRYSPDKRSYAVGVYRSHTREGMGLSEEDLALFDQFLPDPAAVFLLVKPYATRVSMAGFFFREPDGGVRAEASYLEFPFRRKDLGGGSTPVAERTRERVRGAAAGSGASFGYTGGFTADDPGPGRHSGGYYDSPQGSSADELQAALATAMPAPAQADADSAVARFRRTNVWIPLSFIFLLLGVLVGFQAAISYRPTRAAGLLNDAYTLGLSVARTGDNLHVRWDRNCHAVRVAQRGVLTITDGTYNTTVDLDVAQLQNPSVFYRNMSTTVRFRLEVFTKERNSVSEILEWAK